MRISPQLQHLVIPSHSQPRSGEDARRNLLFAAVHSNRPCHLERSRRIAPARVGAGVRTCPVEQSSTGREAKLPIRPISPMPRLAIPVPRDARKRSGNSPEYHPENIALYGPVKSI